jgi:hypothetical protein
MPDMHVGAINREKHAAVDVSVGAFMVIGISILLIRPARQPRAELPLDTIARH